ncbi:heavy metal translocating P-type ATPase [Olsenella urininfantis]|uniref:heavy metal translocating P-type ATPase n=1 Tax=Olsenella urininfantis TaxID=1871033 RepID=UPI0009878D90|nr:heavy metal translocating P-type ATPase [Olsenella urininfantis]
MHYTIVSDLPGRLRLRCAAGLFDEEEARGVSYALMRREGVRHAEVHPANGSILVSFEPAYRQRLLDAVSGLDVLDLPREQVGMEPFAGQIELAAENNRFATSLVRLVACRQLRKLLLPAPIRMAWTLLCSLRFVLDGLRHLARGELTVEVLDATAIVASLLRGSFAEAGTVMFLLNVSSQLERHVQSRAHLALKEGMVTRPAAVWAIQDGKDVRVSMEDVRLGMLLRLGAGSVLPVDGCVVSGEGQIDEAPMTGESRLVSKRPGSTVYAGTALEEGDLVVRVTAEPGNSRIDGIATLVEESAGLKATVQGKAEKLADRLVPLNLLAFFGILALSRNVEKAMVVLMVDFSCAIKLSTPVAVMSAMNEAASRDTVVKGGKYLEAFARADTIVFDKTGTLTHATPKVERVLSFHGCEGEDELLRYAACIEEHFPHSMARAIVAEADRRQLGHRDELHAKVEYVVAHGISTLIDERRVIIGSGHFVFEDEGVPKPAGLDELLEREAPTASVVYMAFDGILVGAICICDPLRKEARSALSRLRGLGVKNMVMLTGDSESCAAHVASQLGIDSYHARVLPEFKSSYVNELKAAGHTVIMVGDGINDSPALAAADVSVAMSDASDIARAVSDVAIQDCSLESLVTMRVLSQRLMARIRTDYRLIVGFNSSLIVAGVAGLMPVATAAYLHNGSTLAAVALNTRRLLRD